MKGYSMALAIASAAGLFASSRALEIGKRICAEGFIMDKFCIERGTLLDNPSVKTLRNPERHSVHCLVDVGRCVNSGFEILFDPPPGQELYQRAWTLDEDGADAMLTLARATGRRGSCSTCNDELAISLRNGFRATIFGDVADMGDSSNPATLTNVVAMSTDVGCEQFLVDNNITMEQMLPPMVNSTGVETFLNDARVHGTLMVVSWGFLLPTGAIIARFGKHRPNALWYKCHRAIQVIGLIIALIGFGKALRSFDAFSQKGYDAYTHACLGITTMAIAIFNPLNAVLRPHKPKNGEKKSTARFAWEIIHKTSGWSGCFLALVTISYGTTLIPNNEGDQRNFRLGYGLGCGLWLVLLAVGLIVDGKKNPAQEETLPTESQIIVGGVGDKSYRDNEIDDSIDDN